MKKLFLLLITTGFSVFCFAQDKAPVTELQRILRASFLLAPGVEMEFPLNSTSTILVTAFLEGAFRYDHVPEFFLYPEFPDLTAPLPEREFMYIVYPGIRVSYRYFYNFNSRVARNRRTTGNSGNFLAMDFITRFGDILRTEGFSPRDFISFSISPQWGIQRAFGSFHISCSIGPVLYYDSKGRYDFDYISLIFRIGFDLTRW